MQHPQMPGASRQQLSMHCSGPACTLRSSLKCWHCCRCVEHWLYVLLKHVLEVNLAAAFTYAMLACLPGPLCCQGTVECWALKLSRPGWPATAPTVL